MEQRESSLGVLLSQAVINKLPAHIWGDAGGDGGCLSFPKGSQGTGLAQPGATRAPVGTIPS